MQQDDSTAPLAGLAWPQIHSGAHREAIGPARRTGAAQRDGAVRYACPVTGSIVLVTDPAALTALTPPLARTRCADCGEFHLLEFGEGGGEHVE